MQPCFPNRPNRALTLVDVMVVIAVLALLGAVLLLALRRGNTARDENSCANSLREIGIDYKIWAGNHNDKFPMEISVTNGGTRELVAAGDVVATFRVMSNVLANPKILICPADVNRDCATNFTTDFNNSRISYLVGADATSGHKAKTLLSGDDNFSVYQLPVMSGLLELTTNVPVAWPATRHINRGNIGLADGSVLSLTSHGLHKLIQQTGLSTNRLAIP